MNRESGGVVTCGGGSRSLRPDLVAGAGLEFNFQMEKVR